MNQTESLEYEVMAQLLHQMAQQQQQAPPQVQSQEQILESLSSNITEFAFDEENGVTFGRWFDRYQDLFENDARQLEDAAKVRLLPPEAGYFFA